MLTEFINWLKKSGIQYPGAAEWDRSNGYCLLPMPKSNDWHDIKFNNRLYVTCSNNGICYKVRDQEQEYAGTITDADCQQNEFLHNAILNIIGNKNINNVSLIFMLMPRIEDILKIVVARKHIVPPVETRLQGKEMLDELPLEYLSNITQFKKICGNGFMGGIKALFELFVGTHYEFDKDTLKGRKGILDILIFPVIARRFISAAYNPDNNFFVQWICFIPGILLEGPRFTLGIALTLALSPIVVLITSIAKIKVRFYEPQILNTAVMAVNYDGKPKNSATIMDVLRLVGTSYIWNSGCTIYDLEQTPQSELEIIEEISKIDQDTEQKRQQSEQKNINYDVIYHNPKFFVATRVWHPITGRYEKHRVNFTVNGNDKNAILAMDKIGLYKRPEISSTDDLSKMIPREYMCPITFKIIREPMRYGTYIYEKKAIEKWFAEHTDKPMAAGIPASNDEKPELDTDMRSKIQKYLDANPIYKRFQFQGDNDPDFEKRYRYFEGSHQRQLDHSHELQLSFKTRG